MRVLVVEDEPQLSAAVRDGLAASGLAVDEAADGESGLHLALHVDYDAIVLDLMLPRLAGFTVLQRLRAKKPTPVLVLTARDQVKDTGRGCAKRINQRFTRFDAEGFNDLLRRQPQACVHKAHIAPRSAMADLLRLKKCDLGAHACGL